MTDNRKKWEKHGLSKSDEYKIWAGMKVRCNDPNNNGYENYGGRGIAVCKRWLNSFDNFYKDMGRRPSKNHSIERIDNAKGYAPGNCRWATKQEQNKNTRRTARYTYLGKTQCLADWAQEYGLAYSMLRARIYMRGMTIEQALTTPNRKGGNAIRPVSERDYKTLLFYADRLVSVAEKHGEDSTLKDCVRRYKEFRSRLAEWAKEIE